MDPHEFLKDFYNYKKGINPKFSYASWAKDIGFANKTLLRMIVYKKRKLTNNTTRLITEYFNFEYDEHIYFKLLISYADCKVISLKKQISIELIKMQRELSAKNNLFLDTKLLFDVYSPVILTIINTAENALTVLDIQKLCSLSENKISEILEKLYHLNLIFKNDIGYSRKSQSFKVPDCPQNLNLKSYYEYWFSKSIQAIQSPFEQRRYRSLQLPLSQDEFNMIIKKTNEFTLSLLAEVEKNNLTERKIYMFNTALFPIDLP